MAFKERFKDKTSIVGKNGENAGLVPQPEAPRPKKQPSPQPQQQQQAPMNSAPGKQPSKAMMGGNNRTSVPMSGHHQSGGMTPQQQPMMGGGMSPPQHPQQMQQQQQQPNNGGGGGRGRSVSPSSKHVKVMTPQTQQSLGMMPNHINNQGGAGGGYNPAPLGGMPGSHAPLGGMPGGAGHAPQKQPGGKKLAPMPNQQNNLGGMPQPAPAMAGMGGHPPLGAGGMKKPMGGGMGGAFPPPPGGGAGGQFGGMMPPGGGGGMGGMGMGGGMGGGGMGMGGVPPGVMAQGMGGAMAGKYNYGGAANSGSPKRKGSVSPKKEEKKPPFGQRANSNPDPEKPKPRPSTEPAREPKYKPYSIEDYKKMKEQTSAKKGGLGLGPSDTDEQRFGRIMKKRAQEFADASNRVNMAVLAAEGPRNAMPDAPPMSKEVLQKNERRQKSLEFAKNVPKPKQKPQEELSIMSPSLQQVRGGKLPPGRNDMTDHNGNSTGNGTGSGGIAEPNEEMLNELEEKHRRDQDMIEAIKKQLKM